MKSFTLNGVRHKTYKLKDLVRPDLNRPSVPARVARIAKNWNWQLAGVWVVIAIPNSSKAYVIDAGHRTDACKEHLGGTTHKGKEIEVLCQVLPADCDMCDMFNELNQETEKVSGVMQFRSRLISEKSPETIIYDTLKSVGVEMDFSGGRGRSEHGYTKCAPKWLKLYQVCGDAKFRKLVGVMAEVWGSPEEMTLEPACCSGDFVAALAIYMKKTTLSIPEIRRNLKRNGMCSLDLKYWAGIDFPAGRNGYKAIESIALEINKLIGGYPAGRRQLRKAA